MPVLLVRLLVPPGTARQPSELVSAGALPSHSWHEGVAGNRYDEKELAADFKRRMAKGQIRLMRVRNERLGR